MLEEVKIGAGVAAAALALSLASPARADIADWNIPPLHTDIAGWLGTVGGEADAGLYAADQPGGLSRAGATGMGRFDAKLERVFDNGWAAALHASFMAWHDRLSGDNYGNDFVQKLYGSLLLKYGRIEIGQEDGAAYRMAITGPVVADAPAIDDANMTFFKTPQGDAFTNFFAVRTGVFASRNFAKFSYYTPRLFGFQLGASYTPHMAKDGLPFLSAGAHVANRQQNMLEGAANWERHSGPWTIGAYGGLVLAWNAERIAGYGNLYDGALGGQVEYSFGGETLTVGGAYHQSNAYGFNPGSAFARGQTHAVHLSSTLTSGPWIFGLEYSDGIAGAEGALPRLDAKGYEAAIGYELNSSMQLTAGFQQLDDRRSGGVFYDGQPHIRMNAGFLEFHFHV
jgi:hypothetical protein